MDMELSILAQEAMDFDTAPVTPRWLTVLQACAVSVLLLCSVTHASTPAAHAHGAPAARPELNISVAADTAGRLWMVRKTLAEDGAYLMLQSSDDNGQRWSLPRPLSREPLLAGGDNRPKLAFGPQGELYVAYSRPLAAPHTSEVRLLRSDDGGQHFSAPLTVHANRDVITHGFESLAVDRAGRVYVAWIDKRDRSAAQATGADYTGAAMYYAVSADGGRTFGGDRKIADHSCECCRGAMTLAPDGRPALLWRHVYAPNIRDHALVKLGADGQAGPLERATFDDWAIDACPHQGPALAYGSDGRRHQTWFTGNEIGGGLFYASDNRDGVLGVPMRLGSEQASNADVAVSGQHIALAWKEFDGHNTLIAGAESYDGGATWRNSELARTAGASGQPQLLVTPAGIVLVWNTALRGIVSALLPGAQP